jgi:septation ring formation regulator EzrA
VPLILSDVDERLSTTSQLDPSVPTDRIRTWRDELAHMAVLLSYARHVLSVDVEVMRSIAEDPERDLQSLVDDLPHLLATASIGGGWSLSPDSIATMKSANGAVEGEADGLLSAHSRLATSDLHSRQAVAEVLSELEAQLAQVTERLSAVETRVQELRAALVEQYKSGAADADDWVI